MTTPNGRSLTVQTASGRQSKVRIVGRGPAVLCLNGLTQTTANWTSSARLIADGGRSVVLTDLPGQGRSEPLADTSPKAAAAHLVELLDALEIEAVDAIGFSFGGRVALDLIADAPTRLRSAVLVSTTLRNSPVAEAVVADWRRALAGGDIAELGRRAMPWIIGDALLADADFEAMVTATVRRNSVAGLAALLDGLTNHRPPRLEDLDLPILVIAGGRDRFALAQDQMLGAKRLPGAITHIFADLGHAVPVEDPARFSARVLRYLSEGL
jgi:pimeloyl-ACP methyl ester carboxylesterase